MTSNDTQFMSSSLSLSSYVVLPAMIQSAVTTGDNNNNNDYDNDDDVIVTHSGNSTGETRPLIFYDHLHYGSYTNSSINNNNNNNHSYDMSNVDPSASNVVDGYVFLNTLKGLNEDTFFCILQFCDKRDHLALSETCKRMFELCCRDPAWRNLLNSSEERSQLQRLKSDYQHLFPPNEFPDIDFAGSPMVSDQRKRYIALRKEVDSRLGQRLQYQSMETTLNSNGLLKRKCYQWTLSAMWMFLLLFLLAMSVTCVLFGLYLENILPRNKSNDPTYSWVIIYSPLGFVVTPFCIFLSFLICLCMGWVPMLSNVLQKLYTKTDRSRKGKLDSILERFLLAKNRSTGQRQMALMRLARIIPMQLLWFPVLLIMIGIKEFFFNNKLWSHFLIPVYISMLISCVDLPLQLYWLNQIRSIHSRKFFSFIIATVNIVLMYGLFGGSMALIATKMDGLLSESVAWSVVFIPLYLLMALVWINAGFGFLYIISLSDVGPLSFSDCSNIRDCNLMTVMILMPMSIMSLIITPVLVSVMLLGMRLDGVDKMKFYWVFAPMYIGFFLNAALLVLASGFIKVMTCLHRRSQQVQ